MPAIFLLFASISSLRSLGPERRDPNTMRAFWRVSSLSVLGRDSAGGGEGAVWVCGWVLLVGVFFNSSLRVRREERMSA